jgi:hypothetical protein
MVQYAVLIIFRQFIPIGFYVLATQPFFYGIFEELQKLRMKGRFLSLKTSAGQEITLTQVKISIFGFRLAKDV